MLLVCHSAAIFRSTFIWPCTSCISTSTFAVRNRSRAWTTCCRALSKGGEDVEESCAITCFAVSSSSLPWTTALRSPMISSFALWALAMHACTACFCSAPNANAFLKSRRAFSASPTHIANCCSSILAPSWSDSSSTPSARAMQDSARTRCSARRDISFFSSLSICSARRLHPIRCVFCRFSSMIFAYTLLASTTDFRATEKSFSCIWFRASSSTFSPARMMELM
mmetsp:Transcript_36159/g.85984  ORF Transcript_36159/g.85984 Transcript_36159/m.85984 type:complete len:225 (+) Transcript_36159:258-932(+)